MLKEKMIAVISAVNDEVAERRDLINMIAVCLLTRKNLFILGDTGAAKSYAINRFRRRIVGARQFERLWPLPGSRFQPIPPRRNSGR